MKFLHNKRLFPDCRVDLRFKMKTTIKIRRLGFTLVELLVVIAIIGILMAMTLPAIQSARESGRRTQCKNNLRNLTQAANSHLAANSFFPSGGWGYQWASDPDRGFGMGQPGGWLYSILPYIEEVNLHQRGKGLPDAEKRAIGAERVATPIAGFNCPTRRRPDKIPYGIASNYAYVNIARPTYFATSDYAGNAGDTNRQSYRGPGVGHLNQKPGTAAFLSGFQGLTDNGIMTVASQWKAAHVLDGLSKTYFAGERYLYFGTYDTGKSGDDDSGWDNGFDHDSLRWTQVPPYFDNDLGSTAANPNFGSAHIGSFNMSLCDGSVVSIAYEIDPQVHRQLGNRKDGLPTDLSALQ